VRPGFITKDYSVYRLICVAIGAPYSTTNKGEVWALQRTKKPAGLRLSILTIKLNKQTNKLVGHPATPPTRVQHIGRVYYINLLPLSIIFIMPTSHFQNLKNTC